MILWMGGVMQIVPGAKVAKKLKMKRSLMMSAAQLGLTPQDLADIVAYMKAD